MTEASEVCVDHSGISTAEFRSSLGREGVMLVVSILLNHKMLFITHVRGN